MDLDIRECPCCGGRALVGDDAHGRLLLFCLSGLCRATFGSARAPLATWLQRRGSERPEYECSPILYAVKHWLRLVQAGVVPRVRLSLNRHVRRQVRKGGTRGRQLALATHIFAAFLTARLQACPNLTRGHGFTFAPGFIAAYMRTPDGDRIGYKTARRLIRLLLDTGLIEQITDGSGAPVTVLSLRHHRLALYRSVLMRGVSAEVETDRRHRQQPITPRNSTRRMFLLSARRCHRLPRCASRAAGNSQQDARPPVELQALVDVVSEFELHQ